MKFHLKDSLGMKFAAHEGKIMKEALTSFKLYDTSQFAPVINVTN